MISLRTFGAVYDHYILLCLQITRLDISPQANWAVSLVIVDGHFNLLHGFECVGFHSTERMLFTRAEIRKLQNSVLVLHVSTD